MAKTSRLFAWAVVLGAATWWARLLAHSKQPEPEGRWRELTTEELAGR
ncbi:MAG TPA: hypothetical protein VFK89_04830 [Actinomycetota bacterium]|nr:hypothetical protein [Actinomycetota bacterium]